MAGKIGVNEMLIRHVALHSRMVKLGKATRITTASLQELVRRRGR